MTKKELKTKKELTYKELISENRRVILAVCVIEK